MQFDFHSDSFKWIGNIFIISISERKNMKLTNLSDLLKLTKLLSWLLTRASESNSCTPLIIALQFFIRISSNRITSNLSTLPQDVYFLTLAYMTHMVWQSVLLHMGILADKDSLPCSYAIWNLMSSQLLKHRKRALKGLTQQLNASSFLLTNHYSDVVT